MSIKKQVDTRTETYTIYSSEMKERMKVYFKLNSLYNKCMDTCPISTKENNQCEQLCSKVYDKYVDELKDRYKDDPQKLDEEIKNSPLYTSKKKSFTNNLWYKIFNNADYYNKQEKKNNQ